MRILVTGGGGFLGGILCRELGALHTLTALVGSRPAPAGAAASARVDLRAPDVASKLAPLLDGQDAVIHTAALSNPNACQQDPESSFLLNVRATEMLACLCAARGLPLAFTSTDLVFDGLCGPYAEDAPTSPVSLYGEHKALAEAAVLSLHPNGGVVCRLPLLYGSSPGGAPCFLDGFLAMIRRGEPLRLFEDEFRSPALADDVAQGLLLAISTGARGVLHLGGPERLSRLEFGRVLARALAEIPGAAEPTIIPTRQAEAPMAAPRPPDVSLSSERALALGYRPQRVRTALPRLLAALPLNQLAPDQLTPDRNGVTSRP